jgi:hypothetical protein
VPSQKCAVSGVATGTGNLDLSTIFLSTSMHCA